MNQKTGEENSQVKHHTFNKDLTNYSYESGYTTYDPSSSTPMSVNQPLPGQPPLPPMPPPPGALPPMPHVFSPVPQLSQIPQVTQIQTWAHAAPTWQWITPQTTVLSSPSPRDITANNMQSNRGKYIRRDRFNPHRNVVYPQRNNFHRKGRRQPQQHHNQHQQHPAFYTQSIPTGIGIDWQRANYASQNDALVNQLTMPITTQMSSMTPGISVDKQDSYDPDVNIVSEVSVKKTKQRKPMSQNYPSRPWNREDAKSALKVENEYNKTVRAQSLIIKFPDPDLNKDIVREFHSGIQNIHFQSPSGPRYCFIQMAENVNIDEAIKELEKIPFGVGHLKVERKSLRDEDYPLPEEIDPYTLYVGNLPESVNVNEVKSKFPTATRVDVGYAQKMRNTRYAFIRYTTVEESIAAYKTAHDLMWDTRSIIVRFRRQRGNTCLPGEPKGNVKKLKEDPDDVDVKKEERASCNGITQKDKETNKKNSDNLKTSSPVESSTTSPTSIETTSKSTPAIAIPIPIQESPLPVTDLNNSEIITTIKAEPEDYDEMEMSYLPMDDDDSDDENDPPDELDDTNDEIDENDIEADDPDDPDDLRNHRDEDKNSEASDHLDHMFNELENIGDIEL